MRATARPVLTCAFHSVDLNANVRVFVPQHDSDDNKMFMTILGKTHVGRSSGCGQNAVDQSLDVPHVHHRTGRWVWCRLPPLSRCTCPLTAPFHTQYLPASIAQGIPSIGTSTQPTSQPCLSPNTVPASQTPSPHSIA